MRTEEPGATQTAATMNKSSPLRSSVHSQEGQGCKGTIQQLVPSADAGDVLGWGESFKWLIRVTMKFFVVAN